MRKRALRRVSTFTDRWAVQGLLFVLPALFFVGVFIIVPVIMNLGLAFTNYRGFGVPYRYIGLANFKSIFTDASFYLVLGNTFKLLLIYVVALNVVAVFLAVKIVDTGRAFGNFIKSLLYFPCLLAPIVVGFVWRMILNYQRGLVNVTLRSIGLDFLALNWLGQAGLVIPVISLVIVWFATGYYTIIYYAGLMAISPEYYEVATIEGASGAQKFRFVTLPLLAPAITINVVLSTMGVLGAYDLPTTLSSGGGPGYYGTTLAIQVIRYVYESYQQGKALAVAVVMSLIAVVLSYIELKLLVKREVHA
jgi:raffinose/stachyose/melibiose transport system permease protein